MGEVEPPGLNTSTWCDGVGLGVSFLRKLPPISRRVTFTICSVCSFSVVITAHPVPLTRFPGPVRGLVPGL